MNVFRKMKQDKAGKNSKDTGIVNAYTKVVKPKVISSSVNKVATVKPNFNNNFQDSNNNTDQQNYNIKEIRPASAVILTADLFIDLEPQHKIFFSGSGSGKFQQISKYSNQIFLDHDITTGSLAKISSKKFLENDFINVTYAQPLYIK